MRDDGKTVILTDDYWMGRFEVTQAQYEAVMKTNPSYFTGSNRPVEQVSWMDAKAFCDKLNERYAGRLPAGYRFDLPTEAQWEYACRARTKTNYSYGDASDASKMNYDGNYPFGGGSIGTYRQSTVDVGSLGYKNAFGLYDMHCNVWEWCRDWYAGYTEDTTDPSGPATGSFRVLRGGGWNDNARICRSAYRSFNSPGDGDNNIGFRLALVPVQ
ncbi:MAG: formylglycine-generating enzyme family protein [Lentisphaeria bacterium]|nr:formylglycine-generating enzyme family protein [Lentisphaeria bacterium]